MKRKIILPIVICLAVVATMTAGTYKAYVTMKVDPVVGSTSVAELAFAPGTGQVAPNFIVPDSGQSLQVMLDFGQVQPNSNYKYEECLKVTNNKPYSVDLYVDNVSGNILSLLPNAQLEIWGSDSPWPWMWENIPGSSTRYPATASNFYTIPAYGTTYISFRLTTSYYATGGTYTGTVTFYAWRWQSR